MSEVTKNMESLTLSDLREFYKAKPMNVGDGKAHLKSLAEKHNLSDREALDAFRLSMKYLGGY